MRKINQVVRLKSFLSVTMILAAATISTGAEGVKTFATPEAAQADPDFSLQGEYVGSQLGVQVVAQGAGNFLIVTYPGGLPGAGWSGADPQRIEDDAQFVAELVKDRSLKKISRTSPTLEAKPPTDSIVLFDGSEERMKQNWQPGAKRDGDLLAEGCATQANFQDFLLHIEFRLPYMPTARGQERGNSGLYLQGRYEVQLLDSFGLKGLDNECGGLYGQKAPDVNACFPPLSWQTYDVEFTAARRNADGKQISAPHLTVRHNGIVIHQNVELPEATDLAGKGPIDLGPILLQDHGNPVRFRNIWLAPRDVEREARRPIVPGFERFFSNTGGDLVEGGRLLAGELNCLTCHAASEDIARQIIPRPAPILDEIGKYTLPEYMLKFLNDPHGTKPGTLMPDLLANLSEQERAPAALALVNFLTTTGSIAERGSDMQAAVRGAVLFGEIGCTACHRGPDEPKRPNGAMVPLGDLKQKYTTGSLAAFLREPHKVRPAGRMPVLARDDREALDLATYLVGVGSIRPGKPNLKYTLYYGSWNNVPKYDEIKPVKSGECAGFNLNLAGRNNDFGMRFDGFFKAPRDGDYSFHLGSDDGSFLYIDGQKITDSDGVHPHTVTTGKIKLSAGFHALRVDYAQVAGEATLTLEVEGPEIGRQDAQRFITLEKRDPPAAADDSEKGGFRFDPNLVEPGRQLFVSLGCAHCHQLKQNGEPLRSTLPVAAWRDLKPGRGCLAPPLASTAVDGTKRGTSPQAAAQSTAPRFDLNTQQRIALEATLAAAPVPEPPTPKESIARTMTAFNCYACHSRGGLGGPDRERNPHFLTSIHEMGDEARIPPPLDGVGDKLTTEWLNHVLQNGAKERPYMRTHMPRFPAAAVTSLTSHFVTVDRRTESQLAELPEAEHRVKAVGRFLAGDKALGCVKCHTFGQHRPTGVQAIDLQTLARRVRDDWFLRYMVDPQAYRPGTRMPTGFAGGKASFRDVYDGKTDWQLTALWTYLKDGDKAGIPEGLIANVIELKPTDRPIIYRNFLEGLTPRGIAVGYPEQAHLAWDAGNGALTLIWHGRFIDAGKHWEGRGPGNQAPLGDHVMKLEETLPLATLESSAAPWPKQQPREAGYRFQGYRLDAEGRPHFFYSTPGLAVEDFPQPVAASNKQSDAGLARTLKIKRSGESPPGELYFRAAAAANIEPQADGSFLIDRFVRVRIKGSEAAVRESNGRRELIVPIKFHKDAAEIVEEINW